MTIPGPHVYTLPAGLSFLDSLASGLLKKYGSDSLAMSDLRILLPTRRAVRGLRDSFLRLSKGAAMILPDMQPIGDVDVEEMTLTRSSLPDHHTLSPVMPDTRRHFILTRLIRTWCRKKQVGSDSFSQAMMLAKSLARFLDQAETAEADFSDLRELAPDQYAEHWQKILEFLDIVGTAWPAILHEQGYMGPAEHRVRLLRDLAAHWQSHPPETPVIAAGSTGSIPATGDLLKIISRLPNGQVILPGLDLGMTEDCWDILDQTHPQYAMKQLLDNMGVARGEVRVWDDVAVPDNERHRAIAESLRPAEKLGDWRDLKFDVKKVFKNLSWINCLNRHEEAGVIALILREALEMPGQTAALVTADRTLARWVGAELARWDIAIDDSAGVPLDGTPPVLYLKLLAEAVASHFAPIPLLAFLKHPLCCGGVERGSFRALVRKLELRIYRGPRPAAGLPALETIIRSDARLEKILAPLAPTLLHLKKLETLFDKNDVTFHSLLQGHIDVAEALAGDEQLWSGPAGEKLSLLLAEAAANGDALPNMSGRDYPDFFAAWLTGHVVRAPYQRHARLFIWGTLEARLQQADVMILGGLNEGSWPPRTPADPWMSQPMRREFGVPTADWRIGQSAHDFIAALGAPQVYLTRAEKIDGTPTVKSRWLSRIGAYTGLQPQTGKKGVWRDWYKGLDRPETVSPVRPPAPKPPLAARPTRLSVTGVELWMRDPYALYARDVLGLRSLDAIDAEPGAAERGNFIHEALEGFIKTGIDPSAANAVDILLGLGETAFGDTLKRPAVWSFWWPRFEQIAEDFVASEITRRANGIFPVAVEVRAKWDLPGLPMPFQLTAKADRIDRLPSGALDIIDYKTGTVPSQKQIAAGYAPQLPLEGFMAERGAFEGIDAATVEALNFWQLKGVDPVKKIIAVESVSEKIAAAEDGLRKLITVFANPDTPYLSQPRPAHAGYGEYNHLARIREWGSTDQARPKKPGDDPWSV